jgi:hypothetical protein
MILALVIAVLVIASIPWALALPVTHWHPAMQTAQARHTYRRVTFMVSLGFSAVAFFFVPLIAIWLVPVITALVLDVLWFRRSRTPQGHALLAFERKATELTLN